MDWDDVRVFAKVVEAGSFTQAARLLDIPKSTVSRRVSELEEHLGARLLQRTTRKLHLTQAGEIYFNRMARVVAEMDEAERAVLELQEEPRGILRLTTPGDLSGTMPELVRDFQHAYPQIQLVVFATQRKVDLVAEGYDLALRAGRVMDSSLVQRVLYRTSLSLFATNDYLTRYGTLDHPSDLTRHRCLIFSNDRIRDTWELVGPDGSVRVDVQGVLASGDFSLLRGSAALGEGITFLPHLAGISLVREGRLVHVLPEYRSKETSLCAVYPSPRHLSPKVRAFIDFAVEWMNTQNLVL